MAVGKPVEVLRVADGASASITIARVLPTPRQHQSTSVRARIANADGRWRPGSAIEARVALSERDAAVVVRPEALQRFRDNDVVFVRVGDVYEARPLVLGARSRAAVEVIEGLAAGAEYVIAQSFLVRADIEKS
ncbi:MAG: efflux transporter periplasmic adaptor subunit, partial [Pseudomonadales bacterium]|nr:efflux transporter periplasmic adaptor subunit [Pseudomonadales bacterium]